jgi:hypothetical protein
VLQGEAHYILPYRHRYHLILLYGSSVALQRAGQSRGVLNALHEIQPRIIRPVLKVKTLIVCGHHTVFTSYFKFVLQYGSDLKLTILPGIFLEPFTHENAFIVYFLVEVSQPGYDPTTWSLKENE